jgi:hypothetical protein
MICPYCKTNIKPDIKFCTNCGQSLESAIPENTTSTIINEPVISQAPSYGIAGQKGVAGQKGPSRWFYALSALILVIGIVSFIFLIMDSMKSIEKSLARIAVPGKYDINLAEKGKYSIFYEYQSMIGNKVYQTGPAIPKLRCNIRSKKTGQPVAFSSPSGNYSYSFGKSGVAVLEFTVNEPGAYEIAGWYPEGQTGQEVVLAIGKGFQKKLMTTIFSGIALLGGSVVLALVIFVVILMKRRRARQDIL